VDSAGSLFYCIVAGSQGTWVRQAPLVTLSTPVRVYDSRPSQPNPSGSQQGTLAFGAASRTINCAPALGGAAATTILFNLTVIVPTGNFGALAVVSNAAADPPSTVSSINWQSAGAVIGNNVTSACDGSQRVKVKCVASAGCATDFSLDVVGYYP
jgi:hypothetical protein